MKRLFQIRVIIFTFFICYGLQLTSLFSNSSLGTEPFFEKWYQTEVNQFDLIFPESYTNLAQYLANFLSFSTAALFAHLDSRLQQRVPIYLHNKGSTANAYVSTSRFRSEFWHTPTPAIYNSWFETLILHEGRHIAHLYHTANKGWWKYLFWYPFSSSFLNFNFDDFRIGINGGFGDRQKSFFIAFIPNWFWEGEAVLWESIYSEFGRGRQPSFNRQLRSLLLDNADYNFNYHRIYYPSDRDSYPNITHYTLGYYLVSYVYRHYRNDVFAKVLKNAGSFFYVFPDFYSELRKYTVDTYKHGIDDNQNSVDIKNKNQKNKPQSLEKLHLNLIKNLKKQWHEQRQAHQPFTEVENLTPFANKNYYLKYIYPQVDYEGKLYAIEHHYQRAHAYLVQYQTNKKFKKVRKLPLSFANEQLFSIGKEKMVWINRLTDMRRKDVSIGNIEVFNLNTKAIKKIKNKSRKNYYYAAISPDDQYIAALYYNQQYQLIVDIYQRENFLKEIVIGIPAQISKVSWASNNEELVFLNFSLHPRIEIFNWRTGEIKKILTANSGNIIKSPLFYKDYLIYVSSYSGIENIYAYHLKSKKKFRITSRPVAAINPTVYQDTLYFNDIAYNITSIAKLPLNVDKWQSVSEVKRFVINDVEHLQEKMAASNLITAFVQKTNSTQQKKINQRELKPFIKFNPFAFHSLTTSVLNDYVTINLIGDDNFYTTTSLIASVNYTNFSTDLGLSYVRASMSYSGFYPILSSFFYWNNTDYYWWDNNISIPFFLMIVFVLALYI